MSLSTVSDEGAPSETVTARAMTRALRNIILELKFGFLEMTEFCETSWGSSFGLAMEFSNVRLVEVLRSFYTAFWRKIDILVRSP